MLVRISEDSIRKEDLILLRKAYFHRFLSAWWIFVGGGYYVVHSLQPTRGTQSGNHLVYDTSAIEMNTNQPYSDVCGLSLRPSAAGRHLDARLDTNWPRSTSRLLHIPSFATAAPLQQLHITRLRWSAYAALASLHCFDRTQLFSFMNSAAIAVDSRRWLEVTPLPPTHTTPEIGPSIHFDYTISAWWVALIGPR